MKLVTILSLFVAANTVNAGCYTGGELFKDKAAAYDWAKKLCYGWNTTEFGTEYTVGPKLSGTFGAQSTVSGSKSECIDSNGQKLEFFVDHLQDGERILDKAACYDGIQKEISCEHGGKSDYENWAYKYVLFEFRTLWKPSLH
ncbi:hypothetical protein NW762_006370 [Fusarium torreyae]|uniref:Uncharacterized protein n=1 Tax=Fusarium torreyae TaxID=1237075 RepID=A0A9W8S2T3_9HYPO|nr:hypothetical protein NW762_006370 [Fusarium torreyae]